MRGETASSAPETSPSVISRTRAPASRIASMPSSWRGRSSTTTITSRDVDAAALGDQPDGLAERAVEVEQVGDLLAAGHLLHVDARARGRTSCRARTARSPRARSACRARTGACPRAGRRRCRPRAASRRRPARRCASIGASSFSPSPITTMPSMRTVCSTACMPSTAAWSAAILSPRPIQRAACSAAASVTRTSSSARLRSGGMLAVARCRSSALHTPAACACARSRGAVARRRPRCRIAPSIAHVPADLELDLARAARPGRSMIPV